MADKNRPKNQRGEAPGQAKPMESNKKKNRQPMPVESDDRPRREDELVGGLLRDSSPEDGGSRDEKGVVPGRKKPD